MRNRKMCVLFCPHSVIGLEDILLLNKRVVLSVILYRRTPHFVCTIIAVPEKDGRRDPIELINYVTMYGVIAHRV